MNATTFPLAARGARATVVALGDVGIGGSEVVLIAGPCSVESEEQLRASARAARDAGATALRGGAFKPRTSPYSFQGLGREGLELLRAVADEVGLAVVTEAVEPGQVELVAAWADAVQIGSRNMHSTPLLRAAGESGRPVLLKRGMSATLEEFLLAAETILLTGNEQVVLCERGIRTFDSYTRNCLDVGGIAALKRLTHLPVIADPSHATGRRELVCDAALAAIAAGADGLIVEMHPDPASARSDAEQQLDPGELADLSLRLARVALALDRPLARAGGAPVGELEATDPVVRRLRERISVNDRRIVEGINERLELVARIRSHKDAHGLPLHDPDREEWLLGHLQESNPGPLSEEGVELLLATLLELTRREVGKRDAA